MNIQTSNSVSVIAIELKATLNTINDDVDGLPEALFAELGRLGIQPTGPMMFIYDGVTPDRDAKIDLRIALPVSAKAAQAYQGLYKVFRLEPFHYVEKVLHGALSNLDKGAYEPLFDDIHRSGLSVTGFSREVYQNFVDMDDPDNETRVQIGVHAG